MEALFKEMIMCYNTEKCCVTKSCSISESYDVVYYYLDRLNSRLSTFGFALIWRKIIFHMWSDNITESGSFCYSRNMLCPKLTN